ncbi:MAG: hypothetical protein IH609_06295, partial [Dehalococcoidia bacterium]|nr:hypothetical protein [Dehalococcoidia bacterium]
MTENETAAALPLGLALTPLNPAYQEDPFTLLDQVREAGRVVHDPQLGRHIVGRFEDVQAILNDRDLAVDPRKATENSFSARLRRIEDSGREPSM